MPNTSRLIILLAATLSGDTMLTVGLIWSALEANGSPIVLGVTLTLMSVIPYLSQTLIPFITQTISERPLHAFSVIRIFGIIVAVCGMMLPDPFPLWGLYAGAGIFSLVVFMSQQSLETAMSNMVIHKKLQATEASRILQSGIQFGAFIGGAMGGLIIQSHGFRTMLVVLCVTLLVGAVIPRILNDFTRDVSGKNSQSIQDGRNEGIDYIYENENLAKKGLLWSALLGIGILTIQLGAFNYLIPVIFQKIKLWQASDYGIVSACAGFGALLATTSLFPKQIMKLITLFSFLGIWIFDIALAVTGNVIIASISAFFLGFAFNATRIAQRVRIYESISNRQEGAEWAKRSTLVLQMTKTIVPLFFAFTLMHVGMNSAAYLLSATGVFVTVLLAIVVFYQIKISESLGQYANES